MAVIQKYERGDTMRVRGTFRDEDGDLVDPTTPTVIVYKPDKTIKETTVMTKISTGIYRADIATELTDDLGYWIVKVWGLYGSKRILNSEKIMMVDVI